MQFSGEASVPNNGFTHQALVYGSDGEFMDVALPFVEAGLSEGQPTLVAVQDRHVENMRTALGDPGEGLTLCPVEEWYETSARSREKFGRWAAEQTDRGGRARLMGEPPWAAGTRGPGAGLGPARVGDQCRLRGAAGHAHLSL